MKRAGPSATSNFRYLHTVGGFNSFGKWDTVEVDVRCFGLTVSGQSEVTPEAALQQFCYKLPNALEVLISIQQRVFRFSEHMLRFLGLALCTSQRRKNVPSSTPNKLTMHVPTQWLMFQIVSKMNALSLEASKAFSHGTELANSLNEEVRTGAPVKF